jgi:hypothetical protein
MDPAQDDLDAALAIEFGQSVSPRREFGHDGETHQVDGFLDVVGRERLVHDLDFMLRRRERG